MIPVDGCQLYVDAPDMQISTEPPEQIEGAAGVGINGSGFVVTVIVVVSEQSVVLFCPITVYVVVTPGLAITLLPVVALNPVAGDHV
jgi:hypothetical protein